MAKLTGVACVQGEAGDYFYIIKAGEAVVYQDTEGGPKKVNHLFKADYFGEQALLTSAPRCVMLPSSCRCAGKPGDEVSDQQPHVLPAPVPA